MTVTPVHIRDRKQSSRNFQGPALGVNDATEIDRYRYFRAGTAITAGQWVSLQLGDARSVQLSLDNIAQSSGVGVALDGATAGEVTAGKLIRVQVAGIHPAASVATVAGSTGFWACISATSGRCDAIDPAGIDALVLSKALALRMGILLEASAGGLASVLIIPRFL